MKLARAKKKRASGDRVEAPADVQAAATRAQRMIEDLAAFRSRVASGVFVDDDDSDGRKRTVAHLRNLAARVDLAWRALTGKKNVESEIVMRFIDAIVDAGRRAGDFDRVAWARRTFVARFPEDDDDGDESSLQDALREAIDLYRQRRCIQWKPLLRIVEEHFAVSFASSEVLRNAYGRWRKS